MTIECMRGSIGVFLAATLLAVAGAQTEGSEVKTYRDWKRLRAQARTAGDFHKLDAWCEKQAELYQKRAAGYEAELHDYYRNPSARPVPKTPPFEQNLKTLIAHYRDLARTWSDLAAVMSQKAAELNSAARLQ